MIFLDCFKWLEQPKQQFISMVYFMMSQMYTAVAPMATREEYHMGIPTGVIENKRSLQLGPNEKRQWEQYFG